MSFDGQASLQPLPRGQGLLQQRFENIFLKIGMELKKRGYESSWRSTRPVLHAAETQRLLENMKSNMFAWELLHCFGKFLKLTLFILHEAS